MRCGCVAVVGGGRIAPNDIREVFYGSVWDWDVRSLATMFTANTSPISPPSPKLSRHKRHPDLLRSHSLHNILEHGTTTTKETAPTMGA